MKFWVAEQLICPECLPDENVLELAVSRQGSDDVHEGELLCPICGCDYPIRDGIARVLPRETAVHIDGHGGYNAPLMLSAYLWSHFSDLMGDVRATDAYGVWAANIPSIQGNALDIGCAVGRLSFELSRTHDRVIGVDTSPAFIAKAREICRSKEVDFDLVVEGHLCEHRHLSLDRKWNFEHVDFIVADALALPFPGQSFAGAAAINLLEKVPNPLKHLKEVNRVLKTDESMFLFSDPFSWDPAFSRPELWLGGQRNGDGPYSHRGIDTMRRFFGGEFGVFDPPLGIAAQGDVSWTIRKTPNLWEQITSQFLLGRRNGTSR
jgi:SAM-dependent methyltransferase/uncharacterized protein YbaR (Trm112 family)